MSYYRATASEDGVIFEYALPDGRGWRKSDVLADVTLEKLENFIEGRLPNRGLPEPLIRQSADWWIRIEGTRCRIYLQQEDARGGRAYYARPSEISSEVVKDILRAIANDIDLDFQDSEVKEDDVACFSIGDKAELIADLIREETRGLYEVSTDRGLVKITPAENHEEFFAGFIAGVRRMLQ